jgi:protein gp37
MPIWKGQEVSPQVSFDDPASWHKPKTCFLRSLSCPAPELKIAAIDL